MYKTMCIWPNHGATAPSTNVMYMVSHCFFLTITGLPHVDRHDALLHLQRRVAAEGPTGARVPRDALRARCHMHIMGDTSLELCARGELRRRHFYPLSLECIAVACSSVSPVVCAVSEYCSLDQRMYYGHVISACSSTFIC